MSYCDSIEFPNYYWEETDGCKFTKGYITLSRNSTRYSKNMAFVPCFSGAWYPIHNQVAGPRSTLGSAAHRKDDWGSSYYPPITRGFLITMVCSRIYRWEKLQ